MGLENELVNLDAERLERIVDVVGDEVRAGHDAGDQLTVYLEDKYRVANALGDMIRDRLWADAQDGLVAPSHALAMASGARLAIIALVQYAEAQAFEGQFPEEPLT